MVEIIQKKGEENVIFSDEIVEETEPSRIQQHFSGSTVFITGGTGFLGKLIIEKLLRSCPDIKKIYMLIRSKKEKTTEDRLQEIIENVLWDTLKRKNPKFQEKICLVTGDIAFPDLGLSDEDQQNLINEVNCVFHCAATVRFDEKIRTATHINVRGTRDILLLSRKMKHLKSFIYVSTAFSHCIRKEINEEFYDSIISGDKLITLVETLDDEMLSSITPVILGDWPNTYAFTKAVAEDIVKSYSHGLPVAIVRPSIVLSTAKEPVAGWIDNIYGATGVLIGAALGLIRTLHCKRECSADMVPADYVINCSIAASWEIATPKHSNDVKETTLTEVHGETKNDEPIIYNYVCSTQKPITWREYMRLAEKYLTHIPSPLIVWHYCFILTSSYNFHLLLIFLLHKIPAYIVDFLAMCIGRKPLLVKGYKKIDKFLHVLSYFATREWHFRNDNTQSLWKKLNEEDKKIFEFDLDLFDWETYFFTYARGGRVYLCKDPLDTLPQGRIKYRKVQIAHYTLCAVLIFLFVKFIMFLWNCLF